MISLHILSLIPYIKCLYCTSNAHEERERDKLSQPSGMYYLMLPPPHPTQPGHNHHTYGSPLLYDL